jgi:DNA invertase Pin-like site-specific DNA recombinase
MSTPAKLRCAVYTRKSSEEGLDQEFNSLDAQHEACAAFIASQAGLGWKLVAERYDDGGISGGTMDRPALQRLLQHIRERKIDVVVVYKIDRLTRSLMDFSRIVEIFDGSGVSFVSVTQQFNTTSSMGRLTLNVLLSFAQFEREVTAERIRDKIAASKKKGMWMGGHVPIGYRVADRKLIVDDASADRVRHLFRRYVELGSVTALTREINGFCQTDDAALRPTLPSRRVSRGQLYHLLSNPIYIGKIRHRDQTYDGEHRGIIEPPMFEQVQNLLADKAPERRSRSNRSDVHLLTGLVFDETGDRLSPTYANNHGRRYRYYISHRLKTGAAKEGGWRVSVDELERVVLRQTLDLLRDRQLLAQWLQETAPTARIEQGLETAGKMATALLGDSTADQRKRLLRTIFRRITLSSAGMRFIVRRQALVQLLLSGADSASGDQSPSADDAHEEEFVIDREIAIRRRGVGARVIISGSAAQEPDASLIDLIAKAHLYLARLCDGSVSSIVDLAGELSIHRADISRILPLAFLSPAITDAILNGRQSPDITARSLARLVDIPPSWQEQAAALGA